MALTSIPAALAQYNASLPWNTSIATAQSAQAAIQYLIVNRAQRTGDAGWDMNFESLQKQLDDINTFLGGTAPRAFGRSRRNRAAFSGQSAIR